jgi:hypothetical protein
VDGLNNSIDFTENTMIRHLKAHRSSVLGSLLLASSIAAAVVMFATVGVSAQTTTGPSAQL